MNSISQPSQSPGRCTPLYGNAQTVHLLDLMRRFFFFTVFFVTLILAQPLFGQVKKSEQAFQTYLKQLHANNIDTIVIIKLGCAGCDVVYKYSSKHITDEQSIYVLTNHIGNFTLAVFDDLDTAKFISIDTCSLFKFINQNKAVLKRQKVFYDKEVPKIKSKSRFYPPSPIHYSYEELKIQLPGFKYDFEVLDDTNDHFGINRNKEKWFIVTKEIVSRVIKYSQLLKG